MLLVARRSHRLYRLVSDQYRTAMLREAVAELSAVTGGASTAATTKIRKRCAVSPSGASLDRDQVRVLRLKRGVRLVGHRRGGGGASPRASSGRKRRMSESSWNRHHCRHGHADVDARSAASARKLVSALWQLDKRGDAAAFGEEEIRWDAAAERRRSDHLGSASLEFSKISRRKSKVLKDDDGEQRSWHNGHAHGQWFSDVMSNGGTMEAHTCPQGRTPARSGDRAAEMRDLHNSLTASTELVRVLANVLGPAGALSPTAASVLAALRSELDAGRDRARRLARHHHGGGGEEERHLRRQLAEEARAWKARHREKTAAAARLVASELDGERRSRRRAERVGKKLADALADAEGSLRAVTRELERERAARERLQKVCDELARGGTAVVVEEEEEEELRREVEAAAREELEREREMLQLADELREERVRMKLAEARIQFEEKNAAVDRLRQELEAFLGTNSKDDRQESSVHDEHRHAVDDHRSLQLVLASEFGVDGIDRVVTDKTGQEEGGDEGEAVDDGSEGSDIELNMDGNSWSYMTTASRSTTAKNAAASVHGSSLSDRGTECGGTFDRGSHGGREALELKEWDDDGCSDDDRASTRDLDEEAERYEAIKNLREQMLAGNGFVFLSQGEADADRDRHRQGLVSQIEDGGLW